MNTLHGKNFYLILFLVLPLLLFLNTHQAIQKRSFNWLGADYDPSYIYLMNGLNNACLESAYHIDHPGTPMQVFAAVILKTVHFFDLKSNEDLRTVVLSNPDHYLSIITYTCLVLNCLFLVFIGILVFFVSGNFWLALSIQLSPFYSSMMLFHGLLRISQEVFLMMAVLMLVTAIIAFLYRTDHLKTNLFNLIFGLIIGFGLSCKFLFLPLLILPFFLIPGFFNKLKLIAFTFLGFVLFTLPVIARYPQMFSWMKSLFMHTGQYGSGNTGIIDPSIYFQNLWNIWLSNKILLIVFLASLLIYIMTFVLKKYRLQFPQYLIFRKALLLTMIIQFIGMIIVAKHPSPRYLLTYEGLIGFQVFLILILCGQMFFRKSTTVSVLSMISVLILILFIPWHGILEREKLYSVEKNDDFLISWKIFEKLETNYIKVYCLPSASVQAALFAGNVFSGAKSTAHLNKVYPNRYFLNVDDFVFKQWDGSNINLQAFLSKPAKGIIILNMKVWAPFNEKDLGNIRQNGYNLVEVYSGQYQSIYFLHKSGN